MTDIYSSNTNPNLRKYYVPFPANWNHLLRENRSYEAPNIV